MNDQQIHLANLLKQKTYLQREIEFNEKTYWKVQGVIEYLQQIGVTLPQSGEEPEKSEINDNKSEIIE